MAIEDFGTYSKTDPNSRITKTTRRVTWTDLNREEEALVYKDKGIAHFDGDFTHYLTLNLTATVAGVFVAIWQLANAIGRYPVLDPTLHLWHNLQGGVVRLTLTKVDTGGGASDFKDDLSLNTPYYLKIVRDESVGTYGTIYCYIYTDYGRTVLLDTLSVTLGENVDFRYVYVLNNQESTQFTGAPGSGYTENLELFAITLEVTTQPVTDVTNTAATGNGTLVDLGIATVTAHGHCWATTIDPTTGDNVVDNGGGSLGAFTSVIAGLSAGQKYWVRAYATSTEGTVYGANVTFTAGYISTQLIQGNLAIVQGNLQYIDADGVEKYIPGIPV